MSVIKPALTGPVARTAGITVAAAVVALGAPAAPAVADADPSTSLEVCSAFPEDPHRAMKVGLTAIDENRVNCVSSLVEGVHRPLHQTLDGISRGLGGPDHGLHAPYHELGQTSPGPNETGHGAETTRDVTSDADVNDEDGNEDEEDEDVLRLVERALDLFL
ncbi:hypothetical protein ACSNOI_36095 [Actinomadura kijaniata]|uniref:hypothetical protein n=1 Tax=Actinomadura kijaniata TaxID=46161 RepID=UPI003F1994BF